MTTTDTHLEAFTKLFRGRKDAYGHEEGRCVKEPLTAEVIRGHLDGVAAIGVYPMVPYKGDHYVVWGCTDIDIDDLPGAKSIRDSLAAAGVVAHIERSRSKGYHVWVFAAKPVTATAMRRMLLCAHQVADYPAREVNPKQEHLVGSQFGNYVRLPYWDAADLTTVHRRILGADDQPITLEQFLDVAMANLVEPETIMRIAAMWREPERPKMAPMVLNGDEPIGEALGILTPLGKVIWRDGPLQGKDRSTTLAHLAWECAKSGLNPSQSKMVLVDADRRWGKYHMRANGEQEIDKLVVKVFTT